MHTTMFSKYDLGADIEVLVYSCHVQAVICMLWAAWRRPEGDASGPKMTNEGQVHEAFSKHSLA
jgi:hypothetical protein